MTQNISQLQNIFSYLQQSGIGASATSSTDNYMNTIWSSIQSIEGVANGNDQQKAAGIQNILNTVMSLIESAVGATNESRRASDEVSHNGRDAGSVSSEATEVEQQMVAQIEAIQAELQGHIDVITTATANIEGKQENLNAQLKALQSIQEQIQQKQEALEQLDKSSPDYKKQAATILNDIKGLAGLVPAITSTITGIQEEFNAESQNVANAYSAIEVLKGNAVEVQQNGQDQIIALSSKAMQEVQDNASSQVTAVSENTPAAQAAQKAGEAASTNMFTASKAPQLFQVSVDQKAASTTRISGSTNNLQTLQQGIGRLNSSNEALTGFDGNLQAQLSAFDTAIGAWDKAIDPMIRSIGSVDYEEITSSSEEIVTVVDQYLESLETQENEKVLGAFGFKLPELGVKKEK
ncbi:hypothetical protein IJ384_03880 [bacterium]|nr:hypothetical protein [bacterium]